MINRPHHPQPTTPDTHRSTADFLPGACRTGGRMRLFLGAQHKFSAFVQIVFPSKKRRSSLSRKSGRHMGVERPYVLGHFEVKPLNRGCLATFSDPKRERVFLNRMPTICPGQTRGHMTYETERIGEIAMFPNALLGLYGVICAWRKGRQKPRASLAR